MKKILWIYENLKDREREILLEIAQRLLDGQTSYGPFVDDDARDMVQEASEEILDGMVYMARKLQTLKK